MIRYIADMHLGHDNVIKMDGRPFSGMDEMIRIMTEYWNSAVSPDDVVYSLGDMFWKEKYSLEIFPKLNGKIYLIRGNHDRLAAEIREKLAGEADYLEINDSGRRVVLSHYPIAHWNGQFRGAYHLYGHVHNNKDAMLFEKYLASCEENGIPANAYNIGCMLPYMSYTPQTLDDIISLGKAYKNNANM